MIADLDAVNRVLAALADEGTLEPMVEPCDYDDVHPLDWATAVGLFEEVAEYIYPEA